MKGLKERFSMAGDALLASRTLAVQHPDMLDPVEH